MMYKINSGNPPYSLNLLLGLKFIPMQPVVLHEERSSGKQHQLNTEKDI